MIHSFSSPQASKQRKRIVYSTWFKCDIYLHGQTERHPRGGGNRGYNNPCSAFWFKMCTASQLECEMLLMCAVAIPETEVLVEDEGFHSTLALSIRGVMQRCCALLREIFLVWALTFTSTFMCFLCPLTHNCYGDHPDNPFFFFFQCRYIGFDNKL